jgi:site-specific DNA recombinase
VKTAAIYARVSSERQREEHTIDSQRAALTQYASVHDYVVPELWVFTDEGYSGATLARPGLDRVRDLAAEGQIETLLVYSPDRLSRKYAYQVLLIEEMGRRGVEVVFLRSIRATTPEEQLLVQFQGMIAEYERAQIAERTRRGKRHRALAGTVSVLCGAPYGYRYVRKTESCAAYYEVLESEAEIVRQVYQRYTQDSLSIGAITRWLNDHKVPTRKRVGRWERSTVWAMLRNPAYRGTACFGKTTKAPRQRITRPLRQRGGYSPRESSNRERPREEWIEIAVPALVSHDVFALAQVRLEENKKLSPRRTIEPSLLQGMLVCGGCGYAFYRTSTRTSKRKLYYYRCLGSDDYRYPNGRVCGNRPMRQDALDEQVWAHLIGLLEDPGLVRAEIDRRIQAIRDPSPQARRKEGLEREQSRTQRGIRALLDAYQEGLVELEELRARMPELRKQEKALQAQLRSLEEASADRQAYLRVADQIESFLRRLRGSASALDVTERRKTLRLLVKEIIVHEETIQVRHCIPTGFTGGATPPAGREGQGYLLRTGSHQPSLGQPVPAPRVRPVGPMVEEDAGAWGCHRRAFCGRLRHGIRASSRGGAVPGQTRGTIREVRARTAPQEDAPDRVRTQRGPQPSPARRREAGDVPLPGLHARVQPDEEGDVSGPPHDDAKAVAGEAARGTSRASSTDQRPHSGTGRLPALSGRRSRQILRRPR